MDSRYGIHDWGKRESLARIRVTDNMPGWRDGRRCGLKIRCPKGRAGSSPALGTIINPTVFTSSINLALRMISTPKVKMGLWRVSLSTSLSFEWITAPRFCESIHCIFQSIRCAACVFSRDALDRVQSCGPEKLKKIFTTPEMFCSL